MPYKIEWLPVALKDMAGLRAFIQAKNPAAATRAAGRIKEAVLVLLDNPEVGRTVEDEPLCREIIIPFGRGNYALRYREVGSKIIVVRVKHNREHDF